MAIRILITAASNLWSNSATDNIWHSLTGQATGDGNFFNEGVDTVRCDANSGDLALGAGVACAGMDETGFTGGLDLAGFTLDVNGLVTALGGDGGGGGTIISTSPGGVIAIGGTGHLAHTIADAATFELGTITIIFDAGGGGDNPTLSRTTAAFPTLPNVTINNGVASFQVGPSTSGLPIAGDLIYTNGKFNTITNSVSVTHSGTNDAAWAQSADDVRLFHYIVAGGATITFTANVSISKATITGDLAASAFELFFRSPLAGWWGVQLGTVACPVTVFLGSASPGNPITLENTQLDIRTNGIHSMTMDAAIDIGTGALLIRGTDGGDLQTLNMAGNTLICGAITLGTGGENTGSGILTLTTGIANIASVADGNAINDRNAFHFAQYMELSGVMDLTNIAGVATSGSHHIMGLGTGSITGSADKGVTGGKVHCHGVTDTDGGGGDADIDYDQHAPPGSLATMGVGI